MGFLGMEVREQPIAYLRDWIDVYQSLAGEFNRGAGANRLFFRGQTESGWSLLPSVARIPIHHSARNESENKYQPYTHEAEWTLFHRFRRYAAQHFANDASEWRMLFNASHYGLPTRLLDWTNNPLVALFFAVEGALRNNAEGSAVFAVVRRQESSSAFKPFDVFEAEKLQLSPLEEGGLRLVYPNHVSSRIKAQGSVFLLCGDPPTPIDQYTTSDLTSIACCGDHLQIEVERLLKWLVPSASRPRILMELAQVGIHHQMLFPDDLDRVAQSLVWSQFDLPQLVDSCA